MAGGKVKTKISVMDSWLREVANSKDTVTSYKLGIGKFLEYCGCSLEDIVKEWDSVTTYREEKMFKKKWSRKIKEFKAILNFDNNLTQGTTNTYLIPISSFFNYLEIPIKITYYKKSVVYHNKDIQREEIDSIIKNTPKIRDQAFFSMMVQSGLRPIVISRLQYEDIKQDWENKITPCKINVPKHKNKGEYKQHYTFIAQESIDLLRKYFDSRFGMGKNPKDEDLLFSQSKGENIPLNIDSESGIFSRVALQLGITERKEYGKPKAIRMYSLRKFFRNNIVDSPEIDSVDCHFFMGHKLDMNDEHYYSAQNVEKFRRKYDKASEFIKISDIPDTYKEQVKYLKTIMTKQETELKDLRRKVEYLSSPEYLRKAIQEAIEFANRTVKEQNK